MGALFRVLAVIEFAIVGLVTLNKILAAIAWGEYGAILMALIVCMIAVLAILPLYVLGNLVDEVKALREKVFAPAPTNEEAHNRKLMASGGWKCRCGRTNADYVSTCACGKSKHEEKL